MSELQSGQVPPRTAGQRFSAVQGELAAIGIAKLQKNKDQNFMFRGIDDVQKALSPLLVKHGLVIIPDILEHRAELRVNAEGKVRYHVYVKMRLNIHSTDAWNDIIPFDSYGEALDSSDKATPKAVSGAYKSGILSAFVIPTEASDDPDATTGEDPAPQTVAQTITAEQATTLEADVRTAGGNGAAILAHFGVKTWAALTQAQHDGIRNKLAKKVA